MVVSEVLERCQGISDSSYYSKSSKSAETLQACGAKKVTTPRSTGIQCYAQINNNTFYPPVKSPLKIKTGHPFGCRFTKKIVNLPYATCRIPEPCLFGLAIVSAWASSMTLNLFTWFNTPSALLRSHLAHRPFLLYMDIRCTQPYPLQMDFSVGDNSFIFAIFAVCFLTGDATSDNMWFRVWRKTIFGLTSSSSIIRGLGLILGVQLTPQT